MQQVAACAIAPAFVSSTASTMLSFLPITAFISLVSAFANPLPCSGTCNDTHDPSLIRRTADGRYYRFATHGNIYSARTILGPWTHLGSILPSGSSISNSGAKELWAPDVHQRADGSYVLYYAVSSFGTQTSAIGVATSPNMDPGSWIDHGAVLTSKTGDNYNAIDPSVLVVGGKQYLTFGSFWGDIFQTTLSSDGLKWSGQAPYNVEFNATAPQPSEGAYMFPYGKFYYLFFSSGSCCGYDTNRPKPGDEYKIMVCRSVSVTGPFTDAKGRSCTQSGGTLVLGSHGTVYGPGGQGVFNDPSNGPVLYYHYVDTTVGYSDGDKKLGINRIDFSSGWPVV